MARDSNLLMPAREGTAVPLANCRRKRSRGALAIHISVKTIRAIAAVGIAQPEEVRDALCLLVSFVQ